MFYSIRYATKQAFVQVVRNRAMGVASIFSITAILLILGLFFVLVVNINVAVEKAMGDFDTVQICLLDETEYTQTESMMETLGNMKGVTGTTYLSKEDALQDWKADWGENARMLDTLADNPLPNSIIVAVSELTDANAVAEKAGTLEGVEDVIYYKETVEKLVKITDFMQMAALIIMAFLVIVSIVVVSNTIKLTVFARAREINIMKYIGATNWFIRGPFLIEGMLIGLVSALVSTGVVALVYSKIMSLIANEIFTILQMPMVPVEFLVFNLIWIFIALGVSIGAFGSIVSMRRFLDT